MSKRQIIAILMLSPFYFTMTLRQRFEVFRIVYRNAPLRAERLGLQA
ncbi:MAG: hypothetical protein V1816_18615 [Pseudomonadota bacterium]